MGNLAKYFGQILIGLVIGFGLVLVLVIAVKVRVIVLVMSIGRFSDVRNGLVLCNCRFFRPITYL
jgi:hypothetical protein